MTEQELKANPIFNAKGDDNVASRTIIKGNSTGLFQLNAVKYNWAKSLYQVMI
jgi:ribonucleoside-diphosphate reductase beta chain